MQTAIEGTLQDIRYALRTFQRNPFFVVTAILVVTLGIGGATAVFSAVDRVLFRALPYAGSDRLVSVGMMAPLDSHEFAFPEWYFQLRRISGPFEGVTAFQAATITTDLTEDSPIRLSALRVEANFLSLFGVRPIVGRTFTLEEDRPEGPRVAMLSHDFWRSRFGADAGVVGRSIALDGTPVEIIGVLPRDFVTPTLTKADVLLPLALNEATERSSRALRVFARLKPGITPAAATAELQPAFQRALETAPPAFRKEISLRIRGLRERQVGEARAASLALLGSVLAVLLIASANIACLLLARAIAREKEVAVRTALGATRSRLIRQTLTESLILSMAGGLLGCAVAWGLLRAFVAMSPAALPRLEEATIDLRVVVFTLSVALCSGLLCGIVPALRRTGVVLGKLAGPSTERTGGGLRSVLVALQIATSMVLLTGAGLLLQSLWNLERVPLGMELDRVVVARFVLGRQSYSNDERQIAFFSELERHLTAVPGVEAATITDSIPPSGNMRSRPYFAIEVEGRPPLPEGTGGMVGWRFVTPGYFATFGVPIVRGRPFTEQDRDPGVFVTVLSESLARRMFPNEEPIGKRILKGPEGQWTTVVGVARDVTNLGETRETWPEYYVLRKRSSDFNFQNQQPPIGWRAANVVVRSAFDPSLAARSIKAVIQSLDPTLPVETETMQERIREMDSRPRFYTFLLVVFALIGGLIAAVGLFGVTSYLVAQRTREIGVRLALGATSGRVVRMTLASALLATGAGVVIGAAGSFAVARVFRSLLFQVQPGDPVAIGAATVILGLVAVSAAAMPARRAARIHPASCLREP